MASCAQYIGENVTRQRF